MNNYEAIKNMSIEEMTVTLCLLLAPFMEKLGEVDDATRLATVRQIKSFLEADVKKPKE